MKEIEKELREKPELFALFKTLVELDSSQLEAIKLATKKLLALKRIRAATY